MPEEVDAADGDLLDDTDSSLTAGGDGTGYTGTGGSALSRAERFANRLTSLNSADSSGLAAALGRAGASGVRVTQDVSIGKTMVEKEADCPLGYCEIGPSKPHTASCMISLTI